MLNYTIDWNRVVKCGKYKAVYCPDHPAAWSTGYVYVHRIVAEWKVGRLLTTEEIAHHEDEDGHNNSPENIEIVASQAEHARQHSSTGETKVPLVCAECDTKFERRLGQEPAKKGGTNAFCSRKCSGRFNRRKQLAAKVP